MKNTFIVIPIYNEEKMIESVIKNVMKQGYRNIIAVDDGSTDNTYNILQKKKVVSLRHMINRGKGAAVKTGIEEAKVLNADYVVTIDGDGQHDPTDITKIVNHLDDGNDIVLGNRFTLNQNKIPIFNKIGNIIANFFTYFIYGLSVKDSQSGFRGYNKKALGLIQTKLDRYEFDSEVIREIKKHNLRWSEVPIKVYYTTYSKEKKQRQNFTHGIETILKIVLSGS